MKKYYINDGDAHSGPFDIEELKAKGITPTTPIWYEGLEKWTTVSHAPDLSHLFPSTPPPFKTPTHSPTRNETPAVTSAPVRKNNAWNVIRWTAIIGILGMCGMAIFNDYYKSNSSFGDGVGTYEQKVMTVEEIERADPPRFLDASGTYNRNLFGTKLKVHGTITNSATVATFKDAVVRIIYYSQTKTELGHDDYTIYQLFPPTSKKSFELQVKNYKDVNSIGWEVVSAVPF